METQTGRYLRRLKVARRVLEDWLLLPPGFRVARLSDIDWKGGFEILLECPPVEKYLVAEGAEVPLASPEYEGRSQVHLKEGSL